MPIDKATDLSAKALREAAEVRLKTVEVSIGMHLNALANLERERDALQSMLVSGGRNLDASERQD